VKHLEMFKQRSLSFGKIGYGGVDWIGPVQDRKQWRALVHAVMNLRSP
jgi:hypothetical protein